MTILAVLPSPEQVKAVRKAAARGVRPGTIAQRVFGNAGGHHHRIVHGILKDPSRFSHDVDDVAVERALNGDAEVWASLTHLERRTVLLRALERRRREAAENGEWSTIYRKHRTRHEAGPLKGEPNPFPHESVNPSWAEPLMRLTGHTNFMHLMDHARLIEKRMLAGSKAAR